MKGNWCRAFFVDLSKGTSEVHKLPEEWYRDYVGGEGVAARLFLDLACDGPDPLSPENPIIFAAGPLSGTAAPCSGRCVAFFRSPATGTMGAANAGGHFGPALKRTGFDLLVVTGAAEVPKILVVDDGEAKIIDAQDLWGKGISDTEDSLKKRLGGEGWQIASIGPSGENLVRFAAIMTDKHRAFGRGGPGAAMGSKKLKAVAVRGTKTLPIADPNGLKEAAKAAREELFSESFVKDELHPFGTPSFYDAIEGLGILPTRNWQRDEFPESRELLGHKAYHDTLDVKPYACYGCPIACGRHTRIKKGPFEGLEGGGPEYESVAAFGSKCEIIDLEAIAAANHWANDLGLDVISTGQVIATAMEWFEKGILKEEDWGAKVTFGDVKGMLDLVPKIARREGLGDLLADGVMRAAQKLGPEAEQAAMHVKGLEMAADGVRASKGEAVVHAVSPRGADHLRPYASAIDAFGYREPELGIEGEIHFAEDGNKEWIKPFQELSMATNMLGVCLFASITLAIKASTWAKLLSCALGRTVTKDELLERAEAVINLERMINARFGFTRKDDTLPKRFTEELGRDGRGAGEKVNLDVALDSYYASMGWDKETGLPTKETLCRLGLDWIEIEEGPC
ncbi:Aldehyde ferredoxin oxidoreductase [Thermovirga lienii DSM 17291]|uniref:Aldehyde ferredoxin oxidoreductase n=1 Tax=Thermovirga lienii (strain ATCC BAA-1197 / DSM 17291 / Cas60314) TaxID=580340 RepID=G7V8Y1_THELD|nr:aldehyde ferredoxin oxidoreductase family protein [Thermovirga lienii]AER67515.1 Aldehyde ferredoxin oxidoreductase [Thermovirga lienii DSM 17291]